MCCREGHGPSGSSGSILGPGTRVSETERNDGGGMLLEVAEKDWMGKVFAVYGAFWVLVLIVLYIVVGLLLRKHARSSGGQGDSAGHH